MQKENMAPPLDLEGAHDCRQPDSVMQIMKNNLLFENQLTALSPPF